MSASTGDPTGDSTADRWESELERYLTQRELFAQLHETVWVPLAQAESEAGVSRSAVSRVATASQGAAPAHAGN